MNELAKSIAELINSLNGGAKSAAEALARVAPDAWHALVWRVQVEAALQTVGSLVLAVMFAASAPWFAKKAAAEAKKPCYVDQGFNVGALKVIAGAFVWVAVILVLVTLRNTVPDLIAPETEAAARLLRMVKP